MNAVLNIPERYRKPLYVNKAGRAFYLMGGGDDTVTAVPPVAQPPVAPPQATVPDPDNFFTKADIDAAVEKARAQEKDKLYGRLDTLQSKVDEFAQRQAQREAEIEAEKQAAADAARREAEANMDVKDLLAQREQEWEQRFESLRTESEQRLTQLQQERENERVLLEKEREFATLQAYTQQRLAEESDQIAPQLLDFVNGKNTDEIEASIAVAKAKSQEIAEQARAALQAAQAQQQSRGVSVTGFAPVGPMEVESANRQYSAQDIANMDMQEYAKFRANLPGFGGGANANRGLFG